MSKANKLVGALMAAMFSHLTALPASLGIMVPAYFYPTSGGYWDSLDAAASQIPLIAIMNPNSGPGASQDQNYVNALSKLHQAGGKVIGYVHTSYTARSLADVESDVDLYLSFYAVDGFFIDEMTNDSNTNHLDYYASIYQYIKAKGTNYMVSGNPGSNTREAYVARPTDDNLMIFENDGSNYPNFSPSSWVTNYSAQHFVHLPYDVADAATMSNYVGLAVNRNAGWIYITDDNLPNPYDTLPSYWTNEVSLVQAFNNGSLPVMLTDPGKPEDRTAGVGGAVTFKVAAFGSEPLFYQWFAGTNSIRDATNASYSIPSVQLTNAGTYFVQVSNSITSTNSRTATLTVVTNANTYRNISVDGDFSDWTNVPLAYSHSQDTTQAVAYQNIYVANDDTYLYLRFSIYGSANPFTSTENIFVDADDNRDTGFNAGDLVGSEMVIQGGAGYQEKDGGFNEGEINGLDWAAAPAGAGSEFEVRISRSATYASDGSPVFTNNTIALELESEDASFVSQEWFPAISGGLVYTFATKPATPIPLSISYSDGDVIISWSGSGTLQSCDLLTNGGTWISLPAARSPYSTAASNVRQFFRLAE